MKSEKILKFEIQTLNLSRWAPGLCLFILGILSSIHLHWLSLDMWDGAPYSRAIADGDTEYFRSAFKFFNIETFSSFYLAILYARAVLDVDALQLLRWLSTLLCGFSPLIFYVFLSQTLNLKRLSAFVCAATIPLLPVFSLLASTTFLHVIFFNIAIFASLILCYSANRMANIFGLILIFFVCLFPLYAGYAFLLNCLVLVTRIKKHTSVNQLLPRFFLIGMVPFCCVLIYLLLAKDVSAGYLFIPRLRSVSYRAAMFLEYVDQMGILVFLFASLLVASSTTAFSQLISNSGIFKRLVHLFIFFGLSAAIVSYLVGYLSFHDEQIKLAISYFTNTGMSRYGQFVLWFAIIITSVLSISTIFATLNLPRTKICHDQLKALIASAQTMVIVALLLTSFLLYAFFNKSPLCLVDVSCKENIFDWHERHAMPLMFTLILGIAVFLDNLINTLETLGRARSIWAKSQSVFVQLVVLFLLCYSLLPHFSANVQRNLIRDSMMLAFVAKFDAFSSDVTLVEIILPSTGIIYRPRGYEMMALTSNPTLFRTTLVDSRHTPDHRDYFINPEDRDFGKTLSMVKSQQRPPMMENQRLCGIRVLQKKLPKEVTSFFDMKLDLPVQAKISDMRQAVSQVQFQTLVQKQCVDN